MQHELIIDEFAGGGGGSTGIEWGLGRPVDIAINHCRYALGMHRINHPFTEHHETDVFDVDPGTVTGGRRVGLAHFSPDCTHHSKAKGGKPVCPPVMAAIVRANVPELINTRPPPKWRPTLELMKQARLMA